MIRGNKYNRMEFDKKNPDDKIAGFVYSQDNVGKMYMMCSICDAQMKPYAMRKLAYIYQDLYLCKKCGTATLTLY